jgi:hypothetical protein
MFFTIGFLAQHILDVVESQIVIENIFSLVGIFIDFRKCHLQTIFLKKLIFVNKNWTNDHGVRYKFPFNLVEFFERHIDLREELKEFEGEMEKDEVVEV